MLDETMPPQKDLRPASEVMRLRRMGAAFPTRLSFLRTLLRGMAEDKVYVCRTVWEMSPDGFGHAVYSVCIGGYDYSLVAVSTDLPDDMRTDRVIATAWDTSYILYDGIPSAEEIARIVRDVPHQEASRFTERDLVLSRANKSVRLFSHVVESLRAGRQPDRDRVLATGYLMRTTAVYGNGKFGIADRDRIVDRPLLSGAFAAEMLTVLLIRGFTHDLVEHIGGHPLDRDVKRALGIGNATGLGMAPFLVSHPLLLDAWMQVRETALARVRAIPALCPNQVSRIYELLARAAAHLGEWYVADEIAAGRIDVMRRDWLALTDQLTPDLLLGEAPIDAIIRLSEAYAIDTQELVVALVLEPFGALIDGLTDCMATPFVPQIDPVMTLDELKDHIATDWQFAINLDFNHPECCARFWYVSQEKQEPRLGDRHAEPGAELESPLDIARQVQAMSRDLGQQENVAAFLRAHPEHRNAVCRVQTLARHPYAEIRDNLIGEECLPIDMLRCKLAFFGAAKFDPKSHLWTRITLAQGAPLWDELDAADDWWLPSFAA
ncbi:hypothetical protein SAMN04488515_0259 [Cognatiyoonia koreensis]|uniref:Uncharacterized protein n=1 Tax=Cognatiyoonia koreensis TaxID=364200 RepID=A0A1I0MVY4_9RHOB|nr:hypothetical protein [Cognatiyoonia koreensis]SEV92577.1 hypothetical protein SAMN04488515_0259 [Cognatiyoonia koreensis]